MKKALSTRFCPRIRKSLRIPKRVVPLIICLATIITILNPMPVFAQCEWTFYRDSLREVIFGYTPTQITTTHYYKHELERLDSTGAKLVYASYNGGEPYVVYRITQSGDVFVPSTSETNPMFKLCEDIGTRWLFHEGGSAPTYMMFVDEGQMEVVGALRKCKVFLKQQRLSDSVTFIDDMWFYLADSLGLVITQHAHNGSPNQVQGIWFGNAFVGDPLVSVPSTTHTPPKTSVVCSSTACEIKFSGLDDMAHNTVSVTIADVLGRIVAKAIVEIRNGTALVSLQPERFDHVQPLVYVIYDSNGLFSSGVVTHRSSNSW